ncbi:FYVE zinc finger-domain-containing protein [Pyronema domesticum]|uniref:RING-type E3 ubiquitin transferase n=1 Tax=Pyronema omphalodes (strain CBS 100304) TaxID=1076935 RepID=U4LU98_PYROM|nr:FYVE zinc finger-domain-containing protein [Pyronema domesticum]CCX31471.1 Similar to E3 ubiquitin-protein ligase PIB1; acc. no. Q06651 [Pyronema omphalodes CBS 100304]
MASHGYSHIPHLPRWQPDSAAKACPICECAFSFFNRRHHCRRCGRVVCATCSPDKIVIPAAYIVRPPEDDEGSSGGEGPPSPRRGSETGEVVRMCKECVDSGQRGHGSSGNSRHGGRRASHPPPPQLSENDYCPICHRALPFLPDPSEAGREAHIASCLTPITRSRSYTNSGGRMVVWNATHKDTIDTGTREPVECIICFEDFEEGQEIARLECLCRFHKKCIRSWFDRKGNGQCPVHIMHE